MIKAVELTKTFGDFAALDKMNFEIADGCIYGLVGSNGSGKSTLLRIIAGVYYPDGGTISVDGYSVWDNPDAKSGIFFLADQPHFFKGSNLEEMSRFYEGLYPTFDRARFEYLTGVFPISRQKRIDNMSKGMQRQAALILALSTRPKYLLLDEAFDGLDPVMRNVLKVLLVDSIDQTGMTAIISSHNLRELEDLCDHVALIHGGHIVFNDSLQTLSSGTHKIQVAFDTEIPEIKFHGLNVLKFVRTGRLIQMVVKGDLEEITERIQTLNPIFCEAIEPSLEEIFIYEMEAEGYDVKDLIRE